MFATACVLRSMDTWAWPRLLNSTRAMVRTGMHFMFLGELLMIQQENACLEQGNAILGILVPLLLLISSFSPPWYQRYSLMGKFLRPVDPARHPHHYEQSADEGLMSQTSPCLLAFSSAGSTRH